MNDQVFQIATAIVGPLIGAIGAYVAIRADLSSIKAKIEGHGEAINRAHGRIDEILSKR